MKGRRAVSLARIRLALARLPVHHDQAGAPTVRIADLEAVIATIDADGGVGMPVDSSWEVDIVRAVAEGVRDRRPVGAAEDAVARVYLLLEDVADLVVDCWPAVERRAERRQVTRGTAIRQLLQERRIHPRGGERGQGPT